MSENNGAAPVSQGERAARLGRELAVLIAELEARDPAGDVMAAWTFLSTETRDLFRAAVGADDATWARGRGGALSWGLEALSYYRVSNPVLAGIARRTIDEALADHLRGS